MPEQEPTTAVEWCRATGLEDHPKSGGGSRGAAASMSHPQPEQFALIKARKTRPARRCPFDDATFRLCVNCPIDYWDKTTGGEELVQPAYRLLDVPLQVDDTAILCQLDVLIEEEYAPVLFWQTGIYLKEEFFPSPATDLPSLIR